MEETTKENKTIPQKIVYYLGAGASAQCLPVVNQMADDITATDAEFFKAYTQTIGLSFGTLGNTQTAIREDLKWLREICSNHYSVDTYAKKLSLNGNNRELIRLKNVLSIYFTLRQKLKLPDKRYDNFWASILNSSTYLPKNIRIISWNYDSQLELSYKSFANAGNLSSAYSRLGMASFHNSHSDIYPDEFGIFKLNGSAKIVQNNVGSNYLVDDMDVDFKTFFERLSDSYSILKEIEKNKQGIKNELSFAWEHDIRTDYYKKLNQSVIDATVLVVIGYSFPYFNRKIDKLIINQFMPNLTTIYFQAPDAENLKERFMALKGDTSNLYMYLKKDEDQFTFPNELDI